MRRCESDRRGESCSARCSSSSRWTRWRSNCSITSFAADIDPMLLKINLLAVDEPLHVDRFTINRLAIFIIEDSLFGTDVHLKCAIKFALLGGELGVDAAEHAVRRHGGW